MKRCLRIMLGVTLLALQFSLLQAQDSEETEKPAPAARVPIWRCETPGGTYSVAIRAINAVSVSEYVVDGVVKVKEVNIDTVGNLLPRFYYLEPVAPESPLGIGQSALDKSQEFLEEAVERTGQAEVWTQVVKNYPNSTHAHTVEFRVDSVESLDKVFKSADTAFRQQKAGKIKLP